MDYLQEEVIVHPGGASPPTQSHFEVNLQPSIPFPNAETDVCSRGRRTCNEQLPIQQFSCPQTVQICNTNYPRDAEELTNVSDETQFAISSLETFRVCVAIMSYLSMQTVFDGLLQS